MTIIILAFVVGFYLGVSLMSWLAVSKEKEIENGNQ